jgi:Restriction endonuclease
MRQDETWHRLLQWTYGQTPSERLAAQVVQAEGYRDYDPSHPLGGKDGGADALVTRGGKTYTVGVYFPRGQDSQSSIRAKVVGDFNGMAAHQADGMVFVTNQELRKAERKALRDAVDGELVLMHLERLVAILDRPDMHVVREQFLRIPVGGTPGLRREERLAEVQRASVARCTARWLAIGLPREEAAALAEDHTTGAAPPHLLPSPQEPVVVWTAPMGSGKTIAAERAHQSAIARGVEDETASLPALLAAQTARDGLEAAVLHATAELGDARRLGAHVVVDGLDELGFQAGDSLLEQARVLAGTWPGSTVLLTSRPLAALRAAPEHHELPPLDVEGQRRCIALGAGRRAEDVRLDVYEEPVRGALAQPLFALLAGRWQREQQALPRAPVELLASLGRRASAQPGVDEALLRRLAVESVADDLAPVPQADLLEGQPVDPLLATGLVAERAGGLRFVLPAFAQWFAAQALLLEERTVGQLLAIPEDLDLWRYTLALAVSSGSARQAHMLLDPLLRDAPGFALVVLDTAFGQALVTGAPVPGWRRAGAALREAGQAVADGLGSLAQLVADADTDGKLLPLAVHAEGEHLTVGVWHGAERRDDVFHFPEDVSLLGPMSGFGRIRGSGVGPGAAWAFRWVLHDVRQATDKCLKARGLPISPDGPLAQEAAWAAAVDLADRPMLVCRELEIAPLLERLEGIPAESWGAGPVIFHAPGRPHHDLRGLRRALLAADAAGQTVLNAALPGPDTRGGGIIGDFFTNERLVVIAQELYTRALVAYRQVVARWMPTLAPRMEHHVLLPARLHVKIDPGEPSYGRIPGASGHLEPLPVGSADQVAARIGGRERQDGPAIYRQQLAARPHAARWLPGSHGGMALALGSRFPVQEAVYDWLTRDLHRLGLTRTFASHTTGDVAPPWQL